jgi:hypothetical protein
LQIAKAVDDEVVTRDLVPAFVKLLKDTEAEVRTAIAGQIPGFCKLVDRTTLLPNMFVQHSALRSADLPLFLVNKSKDSVFSIFLTY